MFKTKSLAGIVLVLVILFAQVGTVFAAPAAQDTTSITGTVTKLETSTDFNGVTTVLVTVKDDTGTEQTVRISLDTAVALGLATVDPTTKAVTLKDFTQGEPVIVTIASTTVIADEEPFNPVAAILSSFFDVSTTDINEYHQAGFGFGVIAQALWMSTDSEGNADAKLAGDILLVKQSKDYVTFFQDHQQYQFGDNMPTNWGQFKKVLLEKGNNLGAVVSEEKGKGNSTNYPDKQEHSNKDKSNNHGNPNK
jgi:hypothetical protein